MTEDTGFGVLGGEFLQQLIEGVLLGLGACVPVTSFLVQPAFIDDAKGAVVVVPGMDTLNVLRQQWNDIAIAPHIIVVAALAVLGHAAGNQVFHAERPVALVGDTVDDQEFDRFQCFHNYQELENSRILEPCTALHGYCAGNGGDDGCNDLEDLLNC